MSDNKKTDTHNSPSWQTPSTLCSAEKSPQETGDKPEQSAETTIAISTDSSTEQQKLLDLVSKFLQDPNVQHASVEKKRSFLTSKGLSEEQADQALNTTQNTPSTTDSSSPRPSPQAAPVADIPMPASIPQATQSPQQIQPQQQQQQLLPQQTNSNPIPPIITYPESLLPHTSPPPLITPARLTAFAYAFATLSATIYGTSKYLINPMLSALHDARHDFASHAQSNIDTLNEKLAGVVPIDPGTKSGGADNDNDDNEDDDIDAATALFTQSTGTHTQAQPLPDSPPHSATNSMTSTSSTSPSAANPTTTSTSAENEITTLTKLSTMLSTTQSDQSDVDNTSDDVRKAVRELNDYLLGLASSAYTGSTYYGGSSVYGVGGGGKDAEKKNDELANVKKEIRALKGVFVSGKKFAVPPISARDRGGGR